MRQHELFLSNGYATAETICQYTRKATWSSENDGISFIIRYKLQYKSTQNAVQNITLYLKSRQFWIPQTYAEENGNVTYSYSSNNGEGKPYTRPQEIPSHESFIIHTTNSKILEGKKGKRRKKIKNLTNYRKKYRVSIKSFPDYKYLLQENYCTWNTNIFFNVTQEVFLLQHISTLQHVLVLSHGERLMDNQFLSTCSPTCLQLL